MSLFSSTLFRKGASEIGKQNRRESIRTFHVLLRENIELSGVREHDIEMQMQTCQRETEIDIRLKKVKVEV